MFRSLKNGCRLSTSNFAVHKMASGVRTHTFVFYNTENNQTFHVFFMLYVTMPLRARPNM